VAFSESKKYQGEDHTEAGMNGFSSNDIPKKFKEKDYRFLIVAEKYQTGFDEPLLHTMYVDKPLVGVQAVQTLSRLNRAYKPFKTDTFVLDFVNTTDDIKAAFQPYYETTLLSKDTDVNKLNDLEKALADYQVYSVEEVQKFTKAYFDGETRDKLESWLDNDNVPVFDEHLDDDQKIDFKVKATSFVKTYAFLSLILPFNNKFFEELYWFLKFLVPKLKLKNDIESLKGLLDSVDLESYTQHRQTLNETIKLESGAVEIEPITPQMRGSSQEKEREFLDQIIKSFNDRWGNTQWGKNDKVKKMLFEDLPEELSKDENYINATKNTDFQNTKITFNKMMEERFQDLIFDFTDLYKDFADNEEFKKDVLGMMFEVVMKKQGMKGGASRYR
jgi:type I restriction enzyme R subunit